jgi:hypothetical protein
MSENEPPMTDAATLALLRFDPVRDAAPAAKSRVLGRLATSIAGLGAASHAGSVADRAQRASGLEPALLSRTRTLRPRPSLGGALGLAGKPVGLIVTAFLLGGASGAGIYAVLTPPKARTIYVDRPVAIPEPRPFAFDPLSRAPADPAIREGDNTESSKPRGNPAPVVSPLAAERELLDRARKALARGDTPDAERALDLHSRRHPNGLLVEEREALAVKVLVDLGRGDEARRRAVKFRERYPRSLFGPSVDEAISTIR